jgi:RNA polymerase sigma factor (sigma-70 family)
LIEKSVKTKKGCTETASYIKPAESNHKEEAVTDTSEKKFIPEFIYDKEDANELALYVRQIRQYPRLHHEEVIELSRRIRCRSDMRARNKLVVHNLLLVLKIAGWYRKRGVEFDDLVQDGNIGLITAASRYDGRKGYQFSTYATWWIRQAITRAIQNYARVIRTPVHAQEMRSKVMKSASDLAYKLQREPTIEEVAAHSDIKITGVRKVFNGLHMPIISLNALLSEDGESNDTLLDHISDSNLLDPSRFLEAREEIESASKEIRVLLAVLDQIEESKQNQEVFRMIYGLGKDGQDNHTTASISKKIGMSHGFPYFIRTRSWQRLNTAGVLFDHETLPRELERIHILEDLVGAKASFEISAADKAQAKRLMESVPQSLPPLTDEISDSNQSDQPEKHASSKGYETPSNIIYLDVPFEAILKAVEQWSGIKVVAIIGRGRKIKVALTRQVAMYLVREDLKWPFVKIGLAFDGRDHTTVVHNCQMIQVLVEEDRTAHREINGIRALYRGYVSKLKSASKNEEKPVMEKASPDSKSINANPTPELCNLADDLARGWGIAKK